jgi:hypothetical protein
VFDFVAAEYGPQGLQRYLAALKNGAGSAARAAFGVAAADFDSAFHRFVREHLLGR